MALKSHQLRFIAGDTLPELRGTLTEDDGTTPIDLTGAAVALHIGYEIPLVKTATILDAAAGQWQVSWETSDLREGVYSYEIQITDSGGDMRTINRHSDTDKPLQMIIDPEIA